MDDGGGMDRAAARHVWRSAYRYSREGAELLPFLKAQCAESEYKKLLTGIASVVEEIKDKIIDPLLANDQQLRLEIEASIEKYGVVV